MKNFVKDVLLFQSKDRYLRCLGIFCWINILQSILCCINIIKTTLTLVNMFII
jgi:hypothetical protein